MRSGDGKHTAFFAANDNRICEPVFVVEHDDITEEGAKVVDANMKLLKHASELLEALESIRQYANDTLSGRADGGPDDRAWQRECVVECRNRARDAIAKVTA